MSTQVHQTPPNDDTTALAVAEKRKLVRSLGRLDMVLFTICALVGLDTLGTVAKDGPQGFLWLVVLVVVFVVPYALLMAEMGSAFTQEGGPYEWVKMAFGRLNGCIAAILYWVTNPLWVGGSLAFISTQAWSDNLFNIKGGSVGDYVFKLIFIWLSIGSAIVALRRGKWMSNLGAALRVLVLGFFTLTTIIYAFDHGVSGFPASQLKPTGVIFLALVPILLFNYVGFELQNGAAEEMENPQRDVPMSVVRSGTVGVLCYIVPLLAILLVLPEQKVTSIGGFLDAVHQTFGVYGGAEHILLGIMAVCFILSLLTSGAVWMVGSDRVLAAAAYDGAFPGYFGVFSRRLGTPVRVNVMSGIVSTVWMIVALAVFHGGTDAKFAVVLTIAISTTLFSYIWIFAAGIKLRYSHPDVPRPYLIPGGKLGIWLAGGISTLWVVLGTFVALFPGVLEGIFGLSYDFQGTWSVSRGSYEALALGTVGVVILVGLIGYAFGAPVRRQMVAVGPSEEPAAAAV
jgi:amino acid transporter